MKLKTGWTIGEMPILYVNGRETRGVIVEVKFDLGQTTQYIVAVPEVGDDAFEIRSGDGLWDDSEPSEDEKRDEALVFLFDELNDILQEIADLSTDDHLVYPFAFVGLINGDRINFFQWRDPRDQVEVTGSDEEASLPVVNTADEVEDDVNDEETDGDDLCPDYPNCYCGDLDKKEEATRALNEGELPTEEEIKELLKPVNKM